MSMLSKWVYFKQQYKKEKNNNNTVKSNAYCTISTLTPSGFFLNTTYPTQIQVFNLRKILFVIESFQFDSYNI